LSVAVEAAAGLQMSFQMAKRMAHRSLQTCSLAEKKKSRRRYQTPSALAVAAVQGETVGSPAASRSPRSRTSSCATDGLPPKEPQTPTAFVVERERASSCRSPFGQSSLRFL
jgi:hypothetical protein